MCKIAVFGASGRVGRLLVDLALARGLGVRVLVRAPAGLESRPGVEVVRGSLEDAASVAATVSGSDGVCCVFGPRSTMDPPFCARAAARIVEAMKTAGVRRLVCQTGAMVGELPANVSLPMRLMAGLYRRQVSILAADAAEWERIVMSSGLDWTLVKPPRLTDRSASGRARAGSALRVGLLSSISRADVAAFILDEVGSPRHLRERVYVVG